MKKNIEIILIFLTLSSAAFAQPSKSSYVIHKNGTNLSFTSQASGTCNDGGFPKGYSYGYRIKGGNCSDALSSTLTINPGSVGWTSRTYEYGRDNPCGIGSCKFIISEFTVTIEDYNWTPTPPTQLSPCLEDLNIENYVLTTNNNWNFQGGGNFVSGVYTPNGYVGNVSFSSSKVYDNGTATRQHNLSVQSTAQITADPGQTIQIGRLLKLTHNKPLAAKTEWNFGDGFTYEGSIGAHYYYEWGEKTIGLTLTFPGPCSETVSFQNFITVEKFDVVTNTDNPLAGGVSIQVFPNPVLNYLVLKTEKEVNNFSINFIDGLGKKALTIEKTLVVGENSFDISALPKGIYFLKMISGSSVETLKILKQ